MRDHAREAVLVRPRDDADAVDVALHDVAAEAVGRAQRQLEVHRASPAPTSASERAPQRLVHHVGGERSPPAIRVAVRQTPLTATESPSRELGGERRAHGQAHAVGGGVDRRDRAQVLRPAR